MKVKEATPLMQAKHHPAQMVCCSMQAMAGVVDNEGEYC